MHLGPVLATLVSIVVSAVPASATDAVENAMSAPQADEFIVVTHPFGRRAAKEHYQVHCSQKTIEDSKLSDTLVIDTAQRFRPSEEARKYAVWDATCNGSPRPHE
jgi:predicted phosphoribosyltransferase